MIKLLVYMGLLIVLIYVNLKLYKNLKKFNLSDYLLFSNLFLILWMIINIFYLTEYVEQYAVMWYSWELAAKNFVMVSMFIFFIKLVNPIFKIKKTFMLTFFIMPILTGLFVLCNDSIKVVFLYLQMERMFDNKEILVERGIWYYIDYIYCLLMSLIPVIALLKRLHSIHSMVKIQYFVITAGFILNSVVQFLDIFEFYSNFNVTLIGVSLSSIVFYVAITSESLDDSILFPQDTLFQQMTTACFVTENDGKIVEYNPEADRLFGKLVLKIRGQKFNDLVNSLIGTKMARFVFEGDRKILQICTEGDKQKYFRISEMDVKDNRGNKIGMFIEVANTTTERERIIELDKIKRELENMANKDPLTDLYNRRYFHTMSKLYTEKNYLPLCVVSCDLNGLKQANDTYGHQVGDRLIVLAANILKSAAPENSIVTRHGGDEFFILIPNATELKAIRFLEKVYSLCNEIHEEPFGSLSISMGFAIKYDTEESISDIIDKADFLMYESKRRFKNKDLIDSHKFERVIN